MSDEMNDAIARVQERLSWDSVRCNVQLRQAEAALAKLQEEFLQLSVQLSMTPRSAEIVFGVPVGEPDERGCVTVPVAFIERLLRELEE